MCAAPCSAPAPLCRPTAGLPYGRIINIASTRWQQNEPGWDAYGASKGALVALTQSLANSLADYPITVNAISPGWIQAEDYHTLTEADHRQHPSGRVGRPDDITRACLFLADPQQRLYQRRQSGGRWRDEQEDDLPHLRLLLGGVTPAAAASTCGLPPAPFHSPLTIFSSLLPRRPCTGQTDWQQ